MCLDNDMGAKRKAIPTLFLNPLFNFFTKINVFTNLRSGEISLVNRAFYIHQKKEQFLDTLH